MRTKHSNDMNLIKYILMCVLFLFITNIFAQVKNKDLGSEQVEILGEFNPEISDAHKIGRNPVIRDTTAKLSISGYSLLDKKINTRFEVDPIPSARMKGEPLSRIYRSYMKGGIGNYSTPLGEIYFNSLRSKEFSYVAYLKHISSSGSIPNALYSGFSNTATGLSGQYFKKFHTVSGEFDYNRNVVHYYGFPTHPLMDFNIDNKDLIRQRFNSFSGSGELQSSYKDSSKLNHHVNLKYNNYADLYDTAVENNIRLDASLNKYHGNELLGTDVMVDYYHNTLPDQTSFNTIIKVNPNVISSGSKWKVKAGLNIFAEVATDNVGKFHFYPDMNVNFNLVDDIVIPFAGITGNLEKNSFRSLTGINPFMSANAPLENSDTRYNVYLGLRGSMSSEITYNSRVAYSDVRNMPFFINDPAVFYPERFIAVYDDVKLLNITAELAYQKTEKLKLLLKGDWYRYEMTNEMLPWHRPGTEVKFTSLYSLRDKIILRSDIFYMNARYGRERFSVSGDNDLIFGTYPVRLKGFADINLGIEYRYTKQLSAFVNFNNIGAVRYNRWYNYPTQRFNLMGGFTYSF